ncbi:40S ribosomal protein S29 [Liparis tanakae]|uniref:Small ribosomal subunit protein uS14 n=2 Tax=Acanthomorphata TaxID=123368 RepID=A0A4Z2FTN4_9TELE|nr:40S ribosomal protein S29 [Liparis tanakae]
MPNATPVDLKASCHHSSLTSYYVCGCSATSRPSRCTPVFSHRQVAPLKHSATGNAALESFICARATLFLPFRHSSERDKMGHQQLYWSHPRKFGQGSRSCRVCSNRHGLIRKYGLNMCRQCFRQYAHDIGFVKLD